MHVKQAATRAIFRLYLIKPSHYDDDGYVIQWVRSSIPANTLAALNGLALDCAKRRVLGKEVELRVTSWDETNTRVRPDRIVRQIRESGGRGLVALVKRVVQCERRHTLLVSGRVDLWKAVMDHTT